VEEMPIGFPRIGFALVRSETMLRTVF